MNALQRRLGKLEAVIDLPDLRWQRLAGTPFAEWPEANQIAFCVAAAKSEANAQAMFRHLSDDDLTQIIALLDASLLASPGDGAASVEDAVS